jgi:hypothetical protein
MGKGCLTNELQMVVYYTHHRCSPAFTLLARESFSSTCCFSSEAFCQPADKEIEARATDLHDILLITKLLGMVITLDVMRETNGREPPKRG